MARIPRNYAPGNLVTMIKIVWGVFVSRQPLTSVASLADSAVSTD